MGDQKKSKKKRSPELRKIPIKNPESASPEKSVHFPKGLKKDLQTAILLLVKHSNTPIQVKTLLSG